MSIVNKLENLFLRVNVKNIKQTINMSLFRNKYIFIKTISICFFLAIYGLLFAQSPDSPSTPSTKDTTTAQAFYADIADTTKKLLSESDEPGIAFIVSSNIRDNLLHIETNYKGEYKVRFVDYYARTKIVFKNNYNNISLDLDAFDKSIFIMCITDSNNRTLTSQVINLKRRHL